MDRDEKSTSSSEDKAVPPATYDHASPEKEDGLTTVSNEKKHDGGVNVVDEDYEPGKNEDGVLHRSLNSRQVSMIALGGAVVRFASTSRYKAS